MYVSTLEPTIPSSHMALEQLLFGQRVHCDWSDSKLLQKYRYMQNQASSRLLVGHLGSLNFEWYDYSCRLEGIVGGWMHVAHWYVALMYLLCGSSFVTSTSSLHETIKQILRFDPDWDCILFLLLTKAVGVMSSSGLYRTALTLAMIVILFTVQLMFVLECSVVL